MSKLRKLVGGLSAAALTVGLSIAGTLPAAANHEFYVCNSGSSNSPIYLRNLGNGWNRYLYPGDCVWANNVDVDGNGAGDLRFDPDPEIYGYPDVNRYRIGHIGFGYRDWVDWDPDGGWVNPPDDWYHFDGEDGGMRVHTD